MNTAAFLEALIPDWRATLPPTIDHAYFDAFVARNRKQLEATLALSRVGGTDRLEVGRTDRPRGPGLALVFEADERSARGRQN